MKETFSPKTIALSFGVLVILFSISFYVVAWQEPSQEPSEGNVSTPLNVSLTGQTKEGWLATLKSFFIGSQPSEVEKGTEGILRTTGGVILNTGGAENALIIGEGNVGIGTIDPGAKLEVGGQVKITGGDPGQGKVLTSDTSGLGSWQAGAFGGSSLVIYGYYSVCGDYHVSPCPSGWTQAGLGSDSGLGGMCGNSIPVYRTCFKCQ
ncbi:MAG: hypothetical protein PHW72_00655 [Candidatus Pacebacteria bacterium]|nr:hypothetical protein [Candidatus Paceibacterota bacterium]